MEQWTRWIPCEGLEGNDYYMNAVIDKKPIFQTKLLDTDNKKSIVATFEKYSVKTYRSAEETYTYKTLDEIHDRYGKEFYVGWSLFKVANSRYIAQLVEDGFLEENVSLQHYAFFAVDFLVEVIATSDPKVEVIDEP